MSQKITPFLWFDTEAGEAARFYVDAFRNAKLVSEQKMEGTPSGTVEVLEIELLGQRLTLMSAGPFFKPNPSVSFMVNFDPSIDAQAQAHLDALWAKLSEGGSVLMPLQAYPFSAHYGWVQDKYGFSWQLILTKPEGEPRPTIIPSLLFVGDVYGKAEEAATFYQSVFKNAKTGTIARYAAGMAPEKEGAAMFMDFTLEGQWFTAMDSMREHAFAFNEAISFVVDCETQEEVDHYWERLSAVPESEQCGWLKDRYGLSWQIVPSALKALMSDPDKEKAGRATQAMLKMKKLDIAGLKKAFEG